MFRWVLLMLLIESSAFNALGQYPSYFQYSMENGGPSNEIYCVLQDKQGFIWIGCDAGLYRFNGVFFKHFTSSNVTSRAVTGICQAPSGTIYGYNFNGQILTVAHDQLSILEGWDRPVNNLAADGNGIIWVSTGTGLFCVNDRTKKWTAFTEPGKNTGDSPKVYTSSVRVHKAGSVSFIQEGNLVECAAGFFKKHPINKEKATIPIYITDSDQKPWAFRMVDGAFYLPKNGAYVQGDFPKLIELLQTRKITNAQQIGNDIWLSTYSGVVRFNKTSGSCQVYYPQMAFSSCMLDNEGNYWFTTLHNGLLRIPNLSIVCWNSQTGATESNQYSQIIATKDKLFLANTLGFLGEINISSNQLKLAESPVISDIGAMYYDAQDRCVYYNKMNSFFRYEKGKSTLVNNYTRPVKDFLRLDDCYLVATSQGTYVYSLPKSGFQEQYRVLDDWSRVILTSPFSQEIFIAGNKGLYGFQLNNGRLKRHQTFLNNRQISSMCKDVSHIYLLTFDGGVYQFSKGGQLRKLLQLPESQRAVAIQEHKGRLYFATNAGILVYSLVEKKQWLINKYYGLCSNNIKGIAFTTDACWLATGNGVQRLPNDALVTHKVQAKIRLKGLFVNGKRIHQKELLRLSYRDNLSIAVEGLTYRSNGDFHFAYRIIGDKTGWIKVASTAEELSIPRLPTGAKTIEIKVIDFENLDSSNKILLEIYVKSPFWQRWWFYVLIAFSILITSMVVFKWRISKLRIRQEQRLQQLRLENELRLTQQSALKAQMNPHFLFNVLNSIKGYIYENDKKNAARFLTDFSNLVRKVLDLSALPTVSLDDELATVELYINLESMLLQDDFECSIEVDTRLETGSISVPSLLLQPYVENAFKHGLRHKKGPKKLKIAVTQSETENVLQICIEDNGIGRKAAARINQTNPSSHTSFATGANQKRIELLNFERKGIIGVEIHDLEETPASDVGTRVIIRIQFS